MTTQPAGSETRPKAAAPGPDLRRIRHSTGTVIMAGGAKVKKWVRRRLLGIEPVPLHSPELEELEGHEYPIVVYFAETPVRGYQVRQWLPVLQGVADELPVTIVTRSWAMTKFLRQETDLPVAFAKTLNGLMGVYEIIDPKVVVYVNNGMKNFQSLIYRQAMHVHVNHGESDKISMVSNQAKAYDYVVVAGQAAIDRHKSALVHFDFDKLATCGRPQLDLDFDASLERADAEVGTVLYAPTWSGENDANNYTSLDLYGVQIARSVIERPKTRLVYKPHPRVLSSTDPDIASAHEGILEMIRQANARGGQLHEAPIESDILSLFDSTDLLVTDISSVGLDFLYLRADAPILLTDRRSDRARLEDEAPIARSVDVIDESSVGDFGAILDSNLSEDLRAGSRGSARDYYFGFDRGESSARFLRFLTSVAEQRDELVQVGSRPEAQAGEAIDDEDDEASLGA